MTEKVEVDDIIRLIKTDEQTNSVTLKKEAQLSICEKRVMELEKENEQLSIKIADLQYDNRNYKTNLTACKRENRKIKTLIKNAYESERTDLGRSVLKQLLDQI